MKTVLIISYSPLHKDPRILRQVEALKSNYKITTIGFTKIEDNAIIHYSVNMPPKKTLMEKVYWLLCLLVRKHYFILKTLESTLYLNDILSLNIIIPNIIIANDWNGLYLASELKKKHSWLSKIYFDAHEYAPKEKNASLKWRIMIQPVIIYVLKKCKADITVMSAVCEGIAREYEKYFSFSKGFVRVITNAAKYSDTLKPGKTKEVIRLIHHGAALEVRRLELMIKMMKYLDPSKYELTFMLVKNDPKYYKRLVELSKNHNNISFIEPVQFHDITKILNAYDIGVFLLLPEHFNYKYALPNKLFEFIQARLAIAIGPSIEMMKIVDRYNLGVYSKNFSPKSLADSIVQMIPEKIMEYKRNAEKHARTLSAEENIRKIKLIMTELEDE